jgi:hypothetical protein
MRRASGPTGVTVIMGGVGVAILGSLLVLVLRMLLASRRAHVEAAQVQAELTR